ncbi:MAG TPA: ElyC/SanA/YdcF family protein, partial [Desulfuromonadales bacterium]|nr:ElyC/SanA/YdcF family protein [Desulfuromonadales bacterium]
ARESLLKRGVPEEAIELLNFTRSGSYYDALNTRHHVLADSNRTVRSLLVVTSFYHTRRTLWTFNRVFAGTDVTIAVYPIPKDPDYKGRYLLTMSVELVKLVYYRVRYGLFPTG